MKKIIICLLCLTVLLGCTPDPFTGYVVCKEYTPGHMDDEKVNTTQWSGIIIPVHPRPVKPKWVEPRWVIYVANKNMIRQFDVNKSCFDKFKLGQKVTLTRKNMK